MKKLKKINHALKAAKLWTVHTARFPGRQLLLSQLVLIFAPTTAVELLVAAEIKLLSTADFTPKAIQGFFTEVASASLKFDVPAFSEYVFAMLKLKAHGKAMRRHDEINPDSGFKLIAAARLAYREFIGSLVALTPQPNTVIRAVLRVIN